MPNIGFPKVAYLSKDQSCLSSCSAKPCSWGSGAPLEASSPSASPAPLALLAAFRACRCVLLLPAHNRKRKILLLLPPWLSWAGSCQLTQAVAAIPGLTGPLLPVPDSSHFFKPPGLQVQLSSVILSDHTHLLCSRRPDQSVRVDGSRETPASNSHMLGDATVLFSCGASMLSWMLFLCRKMIIISLLTA